MRTVQYLFVIYVIPVPCCLCKTTPQQVIILVKSISETRLAAAPCGSHVFCPGLHFMLVTPSVSRRCISSLVGDSLARSRVML